MNSSAITIKKCVEEFVNSESLKRKKQKEKVFKKGILWDFSDQITAGWYIADLFDVTHLITCGVAKRPEYVEEGIPFLSAQNARPFKTNLNKIRYIDEDTFKKITVGGKPEKGDILYTRVGNCGEAATVPYDFDFGVYVSLTLIKPNNLFLYSDYLTAFLNSRFGVMQASQGAIGIGLKNLNVDNVRRYKIPLPPIAEQKRIVEKLDSLLAQVDTIQQRLNNLPDIIKRFRQSVLAAAVSGKLTEQWRGDSIYDDEGYPSKWERKGLDDLGELARGKSKHRPRNDSRLFGEEYPFIQTGEVAQSNGEILGCTKWLSEFGLAQSRLFPKETLCITIAANIADTAILKIDACFPDSVVGFTANREFTTPLFVKFLIDVNKNNLEQFAPATAQKNINLKVLKSMMLPYPSVEEQTEIVRLVEQYFALADTLEKNLANAKQRVDNLTQSILAKAFKGELVPQDPFDESADKLLERIKAARLEAEKLEKAAKKAAKATKATKPKPKAKGTA